MPTSAAAFESPSVTKIISRTAELAVLPHVVYRVLELTSGEDCQATELERAIAVDPGFSSRLLVLANSAAFGLPRPVSSIREGILFLGYRTIRSAALTVGMFDMFVGKTDAESLRRREWWRRSVDTAICGRWLAKTTEMVPVEDAYTAGLLHLIGKTLLDRFGGPNYLAVQQMVELGVPDHLAEFEIYGCDHAEVASAAAVKWGLPISLQSGLRYLSPPEGEDPYGMLRANTMLASRMAARARAGEENDLEICPAWALERFQLSKQNMHDLGEKARGILAEAELRI